MGFLPEKLLESLEGVRGFEREAFILAHEQAAPVAVRLNRWKEMPVSDHGRFPFRFSGEVPWASSAYYLQERPSFTFDPLFHAGLYYVQEASSMFIEQAITQLPVQGEAIKVLDLCAAPGGKSTHLQNLLPAGSLLVSNEVIRSRSRILADNIIKWGADNVVVTGNDPSAFSRLTGFFDVMVVDAPCSGSGLFRKDPEAVQEWSPGNVQLCSQRQQRILADALPALKENGVLVYATCSYSQEEDESIADWLIREMDMENLALEINDAWQVVESTSGSGAVGYRFYPDKVRGEGFFMSCFRKKAAASAPRIRPEKVPMASAREKEIVRPWLSSQEYAVIKSGSSLVALPPYILEDYAVLSAVLHPVYTGVETGQVMKDKLVPAHALAMSSLFAHDIPFHELQLQDAIKYLQRADISIDTSGRGWQLVRYAGWNLGWINVLQNRVNNYYPKELRILKQQNGSGFKK